MSKTLKNLDEKSKWAASAGDRFCPVLFVRTNPEVYIYRKEKIQKKLYFRVKKWYNKPIRKALFFKARKDFKNGPEKP